MAAITNNVERLIGTNDFITIDMTDNLSTGETISGVPTLTPTNSAVEVVAGTVAVSADGKFISARLNHVAAGLTRVDISCNTNLSGVVKKSFISVKTFYPPDDNTVIIPPTQDQAALLDGRLDVLEGECYNVEAYGVAAGNSAAANTTALQTLLNTAPKGAVICFGGKEYSFTGGLTVDPLKGLTFKGTGWWLGHRPTFGNAGWEAPYLTQIGGTILRFTNTSGIGIDILNTAGGGAFHIKDMLIRGTGDNTITTTGIKTPYGVSFLQYLIDCIWENVAFCNFKIGVDFGEIYQSQFNGIRFFGCDIGADVGVWTGIGLDTNASITTSVITNLDSDGCNIVWQGYTQNSTFINPTIQGVQNGGRGFKFTRFDGLVFINGYFENNTTIGSGYVIEFVEGSAARFEGGWQSTAQDRILIGANASGIDFQTRLGSTIIMDGYFNAIELDPSLVTDNGIWNYIKHWLDVSSTSPASSIYVPGWIFKNDATKRGGFALKHGDLILYSPDGTFYRFDVANGGGLRIKDKNNVNVISVGIVQTGSFNATQTINAALGDTFELTLTGNVTSSSITNASKGMTLKVALTQDGTGGRTFAWPSNVKLAGGSVTLSGANKRDVLTFYYDSTNWYETGRSLNT
jgi:hypothetical protein